MYPDGIESGIAHFTTTSSVPDGIFEFDGVPPGVYNLVVTVRGEHAAWASRSLSVGSTGAEGVTISPSPGASVTGRVRVDGGGPMDFSKVVVLLRSLVSGGGVECADRATKDGTFKMDDLPPARYRFSSVQAPAGFYLKTVRSEKGELPGRILDLSAAGPVQVETIFSPKAAGVTGTVFLRDSGSPAPEATVVLVPQEKERTDDVSAYHRTTADDSGKFTFGDLPPGEYKAFAWESIGYDNIYMDPDFIRPLESKGSAVSLGESGHADIKVTLITDGPR